VYLGPDGATTRLHAADLSQAPLSCRVVMTAAGRWSTWENGHVATLGVGLHRAFAAQVQLSRVDLSGRRNRRLRDVQTRCYASAVLRVSVRLMVLGLPIGIRQIAVVVYMKVPSPTPWNDEGFAEQPGERIANGGEVVYRAYGGTSGALGTCFFTPALSATPIVYWTAELLEVELNAALWGNDFEGIAKFEMIRGARYRIGSIAQGGYVGIDEGRRFYQRDFLTPSGIFKQVKFVLTGKTGLLDCVKKLERVPISSGRYAREASARAKKFRQ
jgi:hypothetical protein